MRNSRRTTEPFYNAEEVGVNEEICYNRPTKYVSCTILHMSAHARLLQQGPGVTISARYAARMSGRVRDDRLVNGMERAHSFATYDEEHTPVRVLPMTAESGLRAMRNQLFGKLRRPQAIRSSSLRLKAVRSHAPMKNG